VNKQLQYASQASTVASHSVTFPSLLRTDADVIPSAIYTYN